LPAFEGANLQCFSDNYSKQQCAVFMNNDDFEQDLEIREFFNDPYNI